jgi:uncharacterized protein (TIGR03067 family)
MIGALGLLVACNGPKGDPAADAKSTQVTRKIEHEGIQGNWKPASVVDGGRELPPETLQVLRFVITKGEITETKWGRVLREFTYKIDPTREPARIDVDSVRGGKGLRLGVYELKGDDLKIRLGAPGSNERPARLDPDPGPGIVFMTLKRDES